jgi:hypothetical protein
MSSARRLQPWQAYAVGGALAAAAGVALPAGMLNDALFSVVSVSPACTDRSAPRPGGC